MTRPEAEPRSTPLASTFRPRISPVGRTLFYLLIALICASSAWAGTLTYKAMGMTPSGSNVDASATFQTSLNTITVTLNNFLVNPRSVSQNLGGLIFYVNLPPVGSSSLASSSGQELTVAPNGGYTLGPTVASGWTMTNAGDKFTLKLKGSRQHTLIGPSDNGSYMGGAYSNGNRTIKGNAMNNPFLSSGVTFTINAPGVSDATTITEADFQFGFKKNDCLDGTVSAVPEPSTWALLIGGAAVLGYRILAKRRATQP